MLLEKIYNDKNHGIFQRTSKRLLDFVIIVFALEINFIIE